MKKITNNTKVRLFFFVFAIGCVLTFILLDVLFYSYNIKNKLMDNALNVVKQKEVQFDSSIKTTKNILLSIKKSNQFQSYIKDPSKYNKSINDIFLMLVQHDENIMQLRYIDSTGYEKIRVDRVSKSEIAHIVLKDDLQDKSSRDYFTNSINKESKVWYSNLDLNIENGKVEIPFKPTLRSMLPLKNNHAFDGVLVINYFMDSVLNDLIDISTHNAYVVNELGNSLVHHDITKSWSNYKETTFNIKDDFSLKLQTLDKRFLYKDSDILVKRLPLELPQKLCIVLKINHDNLDKVYQDRFLHYMLLTIIIIILSAIMSLLFSNYLKSVFLILKDSKTLNNLLKRKVTKQTKELVESKKKLSDIIDNINDFIWEVDKEGKFTYLSPQIKSILGYTPDELIGKTPFDIMEKEEANKIHHIYENIVQESKPIVQMINKNIHKDGYTVYLETSGNPIFNENNELIGYRGSDRDVTQKIHSQKVIEENLKQIKRLNKQLNLKISKEVELNRKKDTQLFAQSKMAAMGEMMTNIAHQWRQPLSAISSLASSSTLKYEHNMLTIEDVPNTMNNIVHYTEQLSQTINMFTNFLKDDKEFWFLSVINTINDSFNMLNSSLADANIELMHNLDTIEDFKINTVPNQIHEVIINIINNAIDVLHKRKTSNPCINLVLEQVDTNLVISIEDNAGGIPDNILPKIFEPYFTTNEKSNAIGLGLHMSYRVITESLKGELSVINGSTGAIFIIKLPIIN